MSNGASGHEIDPSRVRIRGDETFEAIAISAEINETGVQIEARTGSVSTREIELPYEDITAVASEQELLYALVIEANESTYVLTSVSANKSRIDELIQTVQDGVERVRSTQMNGQQSDTDESASRDDTNTSVSSADELQKWVDLHEQGVISDQELQEKKRDLL